ncbi:MAG TPA: hypothetical protein VEX18_01770, partial [Polyangiaceae bacterium]|nr:hypothetical protein [Polyangiaceae bacterium]
MNPRRTLLTLAALTAAAGGCNTAGSDWMAQPLEGELTAPPPPLQPDAQQRNPAPRRSTRTQVIGEGAPAALSAEQPPGAAGAEVRNTAPSKQQLIGKVLGTFKNTYYDFPSESDFEGEPVSLMNTECKP